MKSVKDTNDKAAQTLRLRLHGLDVIEGRQGNAVYRKLVLIRPAAIANKRRQPLRR